VISSRSCEFFSNAAENARIILADLSLPHARMTHETRSENGSPGAAIVPAIPLMTSPNSRMLLAEQHPARQREKAGRNGMLSSGNAARVESPTYRAKEEREREGGGRGKRFLVCSKICEQRGSTRFTPLERKSASRWIESDSVGSLRHSETPTCFYIRPPRIRVIERIAATDCPAPVDQEVRSSRVIRYLEWSHQSFELLASRRPTLIDASVRLHLAWNKRGRGHSG